MTTKFSQKIGAAPEPVEPDLMLHWNPVEPDMDPAPEPSEPVHNLPEPSSHSAPRCTKNLRNLPEPDLVSAPEPCGTPKCYSMEPCAQTQAVDARNPTWIWYAGDARWTLCGCPLHVGPTHCHPDLHFERTEPSSANIVGICESRNVFLAPVFNMGVA